MVAEGDINAGRGAKTTVVYTPPRRVHDAVGNVALSPNAPSSGAGIATLAPIAEVPAGDVDLHAPLGTIDAGEAGIRVSGNINIAALHVVNAANIQVKGESNGIPAAATVNTGALASASAASRRRPARRRNRCSAPSSSRARTCRLSSACRSWAMATNRPPPRPRPSRAPALAHRPDGVVQVQGSTAAAEIRLSVMPVSHRRVKRTRARDFRPWSVPAGLPRGAGAVT